MLRLLRSYMERVWRASPGIATVVQLYGERGGCEESRLELRIPLGARDRVRQVFRVGAANFAGPGHSRERPAADSVNRQQAVVVRSVTSSAEIGLRARMDRPCHHMDARPLRDGRGYCNAGGT